MRTDDPPRRIVFAPDGFKGTISAADAAAALAAGWSTARPHDELALAPMADGGEGTLDALHASSTGSRRMPVTVTGPDDRQVRSWWLQLPDGTAAVELASTSGITLLDTPRPLEAHTRGFGEAIDAALRSSPRRLLLALGGSASTDAGLGTLRALGARVLDAGGRVVEEGAGALDRVGLIDLSRLPSLPPEGAIVLADVLVPLTGAHGAVAAFGPQKGLVGADADRVERALPRVAALLGVDPETPGAGAAGGTGAALLAWGASVRSGAHAVAVAAGLRAAVQHADLVITGEGRFDGQSAVGKVVGYVATLSAELDVEAALIAGSIAASSAAFTHALSLSEVAGSAAAAHRDPGAALTRAGARLADEWHPPNPTTPRR